MSIRHIPAGSPARVNGYLVEVVRHARRTTFVRVLDERLIDHETNFRAVVQLDKNTRAEEAAR